MEPVKFELIAEDKTKPGTDSAAANVDALTKKVTEQKILMSALQKEIERVQAFATKDAKGSDLIKQEAIVKVEQYQQKIKELQASLKDLEIEKTKAAEMPIINPQSTEGMEAAQKSVRNLRFNVQQVARELPTLAMGPQMFFLAISNNIPILTDSIKRSREEFALLSAEQKKNAIPVWRQLLSSVFSWQTAMVIGITLLVAYGREIGTWTKNLFKAKDAIDATLKSTRDLSEARLKGAQGAQTELTRLQLLYKGLKDETVSRKDKLRIIKELQEKYPSYFGNLTAEQILAGKAADSYLKLSKAIVQAANARALEDKIVENSKKSLELRGTLAAEQHKLSITPRYKTVTTDVDAFGLGVGVNNTKTIETNEYLKQKERVNDIIKERERLKTSNESLAKEIKTPAGLLGADDKAKKKVVKDVENLSDRIADAEVKAQQRISELKIAAMREGYERQKAEAKKQLQDQLDNIEKEARERMQALKKGRKRGLNITPGQIAAVGTIAQSAKDNAQKAYNNKLVAMYEAEMDSLTSKYENYTNQRIALEKEYTKAVERMTALRVEAQEKGDKQGVEMLDRALAEAAVKRGRDLMKMSFEQFQKSPEYIRAFEDLRDASDETLQYLMRQMEKYKGVAAETWNPQDLREYTTTLQEITNELMSRNPFEALILKRRELARAGEDVRAAELALAAVRSGAQVVSGVKMSNGELTPTYLTEDAALKNVNTQKDRYNKLSRETVTVEKKIMDQAYELYAVMENLGNEMGGAEGQVISLFGNFGKFTADAITGIKAMGATGAEAITTMEKASIILTLISNGIQLLKKLEEITPDAYDKYLKYDAKIQEINRLKDAVMEYEIAVLKAKQAEKGWFGEDNLRNLKDYKEQQKQITEQYIAKAREQQAIYQNKKGGGWLTNSLNYGILGGIDKVFGTNILGNNYKEGTTDAINNLRIETRKKKSGFLGSGVGGRSQKTEDLTSWIRKNLGEELFSTDTVTGQDGKATPLVNLSVAQGVLDKFGDKLVEQTKQTLEELVELRKQYDEFVKQLREYVSQLYSPLADNMVQGLWDWLDEGKNALDSFKQYAQSTFREIVSDMLKTIVMKKVFGNFENEIAQIYEKYSGNETDMAAFSKEIAEKIKTLTDNYKTELPYLQELLKQINTNFAAGGFDLKEKNNASQSANSSVISQVTEETMTWLAGSMVAQTNRLISVDNNLTALRDQLDKALFPLIAIAANTKEAADLLKLISEDTKVMRRDGVAIKN